ncbi:PIG-L family deacetylase [Kangiella sp. HZ709]|uniref:PIG-L family deacetylase n=1 Tax=Kangiella sp. HZ709 TaxID=2666328 RepID=UPI0012AF8FF7|nr:PIG-L family deacetylase [Kangiella sp. HZ709]MRX27258.1 response regulator [Kangiella sp. HZ709]
MKKSKILVIDDDNEFCFIIERVLSRSLKAEVDYSQDGKSALEKIYCQDWDLIITDYKLPCIHGLDIVKHCRSIKPHVPILLMTGHASLDVTLEAMELHVDAFLQKPFDNKALENEVVRLLSQSRKSVEPKVILAIGAHPDDVEIGCGGSLIKHTKNGDLVYILTLSKGAAGGSASTRTEEALDAADAISATLILKDFADTKIHESSNLISEIEKVVAEVQPDIVYTHSIHDNHQDHRCVHSASIVACRQVRSVFCYQSPSSTISFEPTKFNNISNFIDEKKSVIGLYRSQKEKCNYLKESLIKSSAEYWGRYTNYQFVEPLEVIRVS